MRVAPEVVQGSRSDYSSAAIFTAAYRLQRKNGFDHVLCAKNIANQYLKVFFSRNNRCHAKLGIISSKKILPNAVDRNRAKRMIREVFRQHNIKTLQLDIVVMIRPAYVQDNCNKNDRKLAMLLDKIESICVSY